MKATELYRGARVQTSRGARVVQSSTVVSLVSQRIAFDNGEIALCPPDTVYLIAPDRFTRAYIACALWNTNDESDESGGVPLDDNYDPDDIDPATLARMFDDCARFQEENARDIDLDVEQAGYDFWLTRNGRGTGFWDGDWPEDAGERLTEACKGYPTFDLYVGADGVIYN